MATTHSTSLAPLADATAGQWLDVVLKDKFNAPLVVRWLNVMHQMDRHYQEENVDLFQCSLAHCTGPLGATYYHWTPTYELALRMSYNCDHRRHEIASVGFVGEISPRDALDLIVDRAVQYLAERGLTSAFCLCPKRMDYAPLLEFYDLVPTHPRVRLTQEAETKSVRKWALEAVELMKP